MKLNTNSKSIVFFCALIAIACITVLVIDKAKAGERTSYEYNLITDFIESDRKCAKDEAMCERVQKLCPLVLERKAALYDYLWNEPPFRTRNGGMNITARMDRAIRKCA